MKIDRHKYRELTPVELCMSGSLDAGPAHFYLCDYCGRFLAHQHYTSGSWGNRMSEIPVPRTLDICRYCSPEVVEQLYVPRHGIYQMHQYTLGIFYRLGFRSMTLEPIHEFADILRQTSILSGKSVYFYQEMDLLAAYIEERGWQSAGVYPDICIVVPNKAGTAPF